MGHIAETIHIDAPIEQVFAIGAAAERRPEWQISCVEVKDVDGPLDHVGAAYTSVNVVAGRSLEARWAVSRVEYPGLVEFTAVAGPTGTGHSVTRLEPEGGGTRYSVEMDYALPNGIIGQLLDRLFVHGALVKDVQASEAKLKALLEREAAAT